MILHHPLDVQILDGDDLVFVNQPVRKFMQPVLAGIGRVFMRLCHKDSGFVSAVAPFNFTGKFLLFAFQVLRRSCQMAWIIKLGYVTVK
jgi:hypothetical protein